ncbi:DUF3237 family protein [Paenibacillus terrae]|uniref:DUF3237 family protein n=1 Tax=Paenibacillus terrae TaxID=159743 RepID=UPI003994233E
MENNEIRCVPEQFIDQVKAGKVIDPEHVYFRTTPKFQAPSPLYQWLNNYIFIGQR